MVGFGLCSGIFQKLGEAQRSAYVSLHFVYCNRSHMEKRQCFVFEAMTIRVITRVANRPGFFQIARNLPAMSGKQRVVFPESTVSGKK